MNKDVYPELKEKEIEKEQTIYGLTDDELLEEFSKCKLEEKEKNVFE
jgi:hypothetical protein